MKPYILIPILAAGLALLCACSGEKEPTQPEPAGEPLAITSFSFSHSASIANDCYCVDLTLEEGGTHLYVEELFSGGRVVDRMIEEPLLEQLGELAGTYHVDRWDGFHESDPYILDGTGFTLNLTLADGSTVSAHGNNAFPEHYSEVFSAIRELYNKLMAQYADGAEQEGAEST